MSPSSKESVHSTKEPPTNREDDQTIARRISNLHAAAEAVLEAGEEFLGTMILVAFGTAGNCQYAVANPAFNSYSTVPIGWAIGIALGAGIASRFSGGHINPAVTLMFALTGRLPWWKVPIYCTAQLLGAFLGAAITFGVYYSSIDAYEGGGRTVELTGGLFGTYPALDTPAFSCWLAEFFPATILLLVVQYMVSLPGGPPFGGVPIALFLTLLGVGCTYGSTTSFSINPARDLGPRILTAAAGYGPEVWTWKNQYWLWGGQLGAFSASVFIAILYHTYKALKRGVFGPSLTEIANHVHHVATNHIQTIRGINAV